MDGGILAGLGGLVALVAFACLPMVSIDEANVAIAGWQWATGLCAALLALASTVVATLAWRTRDRRYGLALAGLGATQGAVMAWSWGHVWSLVPCARLGLGTCDATGGLLEGTLVTLDFGALLTVAGAVLTLLGGVLVLAAPRQFSRHERFLRVLLSWEGQIVAERVLFRPARVTIGESDHDTFQLPAMGLHGHALLNPEPDGRYLLDVPRSASGRVTVGGQERDAADLALARVQPGDLGRLAFENGVEVAFSFTGAETARLPGTLLAGGDRGVLVSFCAVAALLLMFLGAALTRMHVQHRTLAERAEAREPTTITFQIDPLPEPLPPPDPKQAHADGKSPVDAPHDTVTPPLKPSRDVARAPTPNPKPSQDPRNVGITKAVHDLANGSGATARIFEGDDGVLTDKMARISDGAGGEDGDGVGDGIGAGKKMGFRDGGHGGPGERGPYHIGGGGPLVTGPVGKDGGPGIGHKTKRPIGDPTRAPPTTTAGCDKGDIAKNVRSRASSIRACYETQLLSRSDLSGKLTVQWTIGSDGGVREAHTTTDSVGSPAVTDCVLRAMRRLHFQAPEAGICVVSWPFAFTSGN